MVKADGLAAGKGGVIVAMDEPPQALAAIDDMFDGEFGDAGGAEVVIEEFMEGEEASYFILCDGKTALPIGTAQDHKRVGDGDTGPNTGGMGAYSPPAPILTDDVARKAMDEIINPTVAEMARRGSPPYKGVLYAGLMIKDGQPRLVEYNVRFGDPECQVLMMRLGAQALDLMLACAEGRLDKAQVNWADDHAITVVMAANGYPGSYEKGSVISGLDALPEDSMNMVFHAGTTEVEGKITATGGRVLNVTARGGDSCARRGTGPMHGGRDRLARRLQPFRHRLARALTVNNAAPPRGGLPPPARAPLRGLPPVGRGAFRKAKKRAEQKRCLHRKS